MNNQLDNYRKQVDVILKRVQILEDKLEKIGNIFSDIAGPASTEENKNADK